MRVSKSARDVVIHFQHTEAMSGTANTAFYGPRTVASTVTVIQYPSHYLLALRVTVTIQAINQLRFRMAFL